MAAKVAIFFDIIKTIRLKKSINCQKKKTVSPLRSELLPGRRRQAPVRLRQRVAERDVRKHHHAVERRATEIAQHHRQTHPHEETALPLIAVADVHQAHDVDMRPFLLNDLVDRMIPPCAINRHPHIGGVPLMPVEDGWYRADAYLKLALPFPKDGINLKRHRHPLEIKRCMAVGIRAVEKRESHPVSEYGAGLEPGVKSEADDKRRTAELDKQVAAIALLRGRLTAIVVATFR